MTSRHTPAGHNYVRYGGGEAVSVTPGDSYDDSFSSDYAEKGFVSTRSRELEELRDESKLQSKLRRMSEETKELREETLKEQNEQTSILRKVYAGCGGWLLAQAVAILVVWLTVAKSEHYRMILWWPWYVSGKSHGLESSSSDFPVLTFALALLIWSGGLYLSQYWRAPALATMANTDAPNGSRWLNNISESIVVVLIAMLAGERTILGICYLGACAILLQMIGYSAEMSRTIVMRKVVLGSFYFVFFLLVLAPVLAHVINSAVTSTLSSLALMFIVWSLVVLFFRRLLTTWHVNDRPQKLDDQGVKTKELAGIDSNKRLLIEMLYVCIDTLLLTSVAWLLFGVFFKTGDQAGIWAENMVVDDDTVV